MIGRRGSETEREGRERGTKPTQMKMTNTIENASFYEINRVNVT